MRNDQVNAMLLTEFLKEHQKVEEQQRKINDHEATIADLKSAVVQQREEVKVLTAQLKDQAAQIQKVTAQVELSKFAIGPISGGGPSPRTVRNDYERRPMDQGLSMHEMACSH